MKINYIVKKNQIVFLRYISFSTTIYIPKNYFAPVIHLMKITRHLGPERVKQKIAGRPVEKRQPGIP
jgi:hypothetical protein